MPSALPRVTFGIIVLNGEPFTRYCLRALYPYAHQIIVVEGAVASASSIATANGHSLDGTLEVLQQFKADEDRENKLQIITRDGFWSEKDEMSQAYAERATGDYLWQVDVDEFWLDGDIREILQMLAEDPEISQVSFLQTTFWGGFGYVADGWFLRYLFTDIHRIFRWGPGYRYITHRPPTVHDEQGRDLRSLHWVSGARLERKYGIRMYHYSLVFPEQVRTKSNYYQRADWAPDADEADSWAQRVFMNLEQPYRVHNAYTYPSWLTRFEGQHPAQIEALRADVQAGRANMELRQSDDVERLLRSRSYQAGRLALQVSGPVWYAIKRQLLCGKRKLDRLYRTPKQRL